MAASLLELQGGGASFVSQVQAAVAGHAAGGRQVGGALGVTQSVALWEETGRLQRVTRVWEELPVTPPTQACGGLPAKVHRVQADGALGCSHVEPHGEAVGGAMVQQPLPLAVLQAAAVLCTEGEGRRDSGLKGRGHKVWDRRTAEAGQRSSEYDQSATS